jgi:large subunit ribosomal protein L15
MRLNELSDNRRARHARKRVGRGDGSGQGGTAGRGHKGQKSRSGASIKGFEGGQMPLYRRVPKRGFTNIFRKEFAELNLGRLQQAIDAGKLDPGKPIDGAGLVAAGVIRRQRDGVRLLAKGELKSNVTIAVAGASKAAVAAVEKAGGKVELLATGKKQKAGSEAAEAAKESSGAESAAEGGSSADDETKEGESNA